MNQPPAQNYTGPPSSQALQNQNAFMQQGRQVQPNPQMMGYMHDMSHIQQPMQHIQTQQFNYNNQMMAGNMMPMNDMASQIPQHQQQFVPNHQAHHNMNPEPEKVNLEEKQAVSKCSRFFQSIMGVIKNQSGEDKVERLQNLIQMVLYFDMSADEFTTKLQEVMQSKTQPHLRPFLVQTIPALRRAIKNREIVVDCVPVPAGFIYNQPSPRSQTPHDQSHSPMQSSPAAQNPALFQRLNTNFSQPQMRPQQFQRPQASLPAQPHVAPVQHEEEEATPSSTRHYNEHNLKFCLIDHNHIMNLIARKMRQYCSVEEDALMLISDATEQHLRELIQTIKGIAEHRIESSRTNQKYYEPVDDVKSQIRFLENMERVDEEQREKEMAMRSQLKSKNWSKEECRELQRASQTELRNQQANDAASAALAGNRIKARWESGGPIVSQRTKTIRINCRDLHIMVNSDHQFSRSMLKQKLAYRATQNNN